MSKKRITLEYLKKKVWWWRRQEIRRNGIPGIEWDKDTKDAARNYELMRRSPGAKRFRKSYLELNGNEKAFVHVLWCSWPLPIIRYAVEKRQFDEKGWTPVSGGPPVQWNLRLADCILLAEFKRQITRARAFQRIRTKHPLKGKKQRSASWKIIEIIDRQKHRLGTANDSDRGTASKGKRMAIRFLRRFNYTLTKAVEQMAHEVDCIVDPKPTRQSPASELSVEANDVEMDDETEIVETSEFFNFRIVHSWQ